MQKEITCLQCTLFCLLSNKPLSIRLVFHLEPGCSAVDRARAIAEQQPEVDDILAIIDEALGVTSTPRGGELRPERRTAQVRSQQQAASQQSNRSISPSKKILGSPRDLKIEACIGTRHFFDNSADDAQPFGARDMV